jgi:hypothetical protein
VQPRRISRVISYGVQTSGTRMRTRDFPMGEAKRIIDLAQHAGITLKDAQA